VRLVALVFQTKPAPEKVGLVPSLEYSPTHNIKSSRLEVFNARLHEAVPVLQPPLPSMERTFEACADEVTDVPDPEKSPAEPGVNRYVQISTPKTNPKTSAATTIPVTDCEVFNEILTIRRI
jgi:hypothetical protein